MSDVTIATPISPSHPAGQGKSKKGGHHIAFMAQPAFAPEAKLNVIGANMWRPGTPGHRLYEEVLSQNPVTVQECINYPLSMSVCEDAPTTRYFRHYSRP